MCDAFAELKYDVRLIVYYKRKNLKFNVIKKNVTNLDIEIKAINIK